MPSNRTSIEIEAKGEFSQLSRGLRQMKSDLGEVVGVVNKGARKGGLFSDDDRKALDLFTRRYEQSMNRMDRLMEGQGQKIANLYKQRRAANSADIASIDKEIKKQGEKLDGLEAERRELEAILQLHRQEASLFTTKQRAQSAGGGSGGGSRPSGGGDTGDDAAQTGAAAGLLAIGRKLKGVAGIVAGIAGISLTIGQLMKWEQMAEQSNAAWAPLLQRNAGMSRGAMEQAGLKHGYNTFQSQQALDVYTQQAGGTDAGGLARMQAFSRGYGVDLNTTASIAGRAGQLGYGAPGQVLGKIAGVASSSGMDARILEVMDTSVAFLQSMDKSLKDNSGNNLLAYTARINQIGQEKGAQKLTGQNGASILERMGSNIFNPENPAWMATGVSLLRGFGGKDAQKKDTMDLMQQWQNGFGNAENVSVMSKWMDKMVEGKDEKSALEVRKSVMQQAMGGGTTLQQAQDFGELTNWLKEFDPNNPRMKAMLEGSSNGKGANGSGLDATSRIDKLLDKWNGTLDAAAQKSNAGFMQAEVDLGQNLIGAKIAIQNEATKMMEAMASQLAKLDLNDIFKKGLEDALKRVNWEAVFGFAGAIGIAGWAAVSALKALGQAALDKVKRLIGLGDKTGEVAAAAEEHTSPARKAAQNAALEEADKAVSRSASKTSTEVAGSVVDNATTDASRAVESQSSPARKTAQEAALEALDNSTSRTAANASTDVAGNLVTRQAARDFISDPAHQFSWDSAATPDVASSAAPKTLEETINDAIKYVKNNPVDPNIADNIASSGNAPTTMPGGAAASATENVVNSTVSRGGFWSRAGEIGGKALNNPVVKTGAKILGSDAAAIGGIVIDTAQAVLDQVETQNGARRKITMQKQLDASGGAPLNWGGSDATLSPGKTGWHPMDAVTNWFKSTKDEVSEYIKHWNDDNKDLKKNSEDQKKATLDAQANVSAMATNVTNSQTEVGRTMTDAATSMKTDIGDMTRSMAAMAAAGSKGQNPASGGLGNWWKQFSVKDPSSWFNFGGGGPGADASDTQKQVFSTLQSQGKGDWWNNVQTLMQHENDSWDAHPTPNPIGVGGEHAQGLFQFLPSTWKGYRQVGSPEDFSQATVEDQTKAFIAYMQQRYGGDFGNIKNFGAKNGNGPNDYKGYADGTFSAMDQIAQIHAGEEVISRAKTAQTLRKMGKLPSQVLNDAMGAQGTASTAGGAKRLAVDVNVNLQSDQPLPAGLSPALIAALVPIVKQVLGEAQFTLQKGNPYFA